MNAVERLNVLYTVTHGEMGGVHRFLESVFLHHTTDVKPVVLSFREGSWLGDLRHRGLPVYCIDDARLREPSRCFREVSAILRGEQIHVVHSSYSWCHCLAFPAALWHGCRTIWFHHGPISDRRWQGWMSVVPTDLLLTNSEFMRGRLARTFYRAKNVGVVRYGIDADALRPDPVSRARFRNAWGLDEQKVAVGIVGFIDVWKGQDVFLQAAKILSSRGMPLHMFVIGGPRDGISRSRCVAFERQLHEYLRDNDLTDFVTFTGHVDIREGAFDGIDVFVHASTEPEPFGSAVLEAMAKGKAIIASNQGGNLEMLTNDTDGVLIEPRRPEVLAEAIGELCEDGTLRQRLAIAARETALTGHAVRRPVQQLEQWYRALL